MLMTIHLVARYTQLVLVRSLLIGVVLLYLIKCRLWAGHSILKGTCFVSDRRSGT